MQLILVRSGKLKKKSVGNWDLDPFSFSSIKWLIINNSKKKNNNNNY